MLAIGGCENLELIHAGARNTIYRGFQNGLPIILKVLQKEYPTPAELENFTIEYNILLNFHSKSIISPISLEKINNTLGIVFADIGGKSISNFISESVSIEKKIEIFLKSLEGLNEIHKSELVHRDIKIQNIIYNDLTGDLQIIDFGSASRLTKQNTFVSMHSSMEGTLAYISPEQTGRMNRRVDYRTDFYSLGVTFYQMFTGSVPFLYNDPLELIHAHIAKSPISPYEKNRTPKVISSIIMKLMEKDPENRYQSVNGILHDLEICKKHFIENGLDGLKAFEMSIGENDFSGRFQIPEKLYGRETELNQILTQFKEVSNGKTSLVLVSGKSGIGKTSLVNEIKKPVTESRGYFISGKFDLLKRTIPYRAISQSFQSLFQQILTENESSIQKWRTSLLKSLGNNAKLIIDLIPELESILGEQPATVPLPTEESQNRFNDVFQNFLSSLGKNDRPLVIFLDDLQWADAPSLQLIQRILLNTEIKNLLLILSYRDNEIFAGDPFSLMLENLKKQGYSFSEIFLEPIKSSDIQNLVSETIACEEKEAREIANVLLSKTKGNPFFINALFSDYFEKDLIHFENNKWKIYLSKIENEKIAENVIDFMIEKIQDLSPDHLEILEFAACVGNWFKLDVFVHIINRPDYDVKGALINLTNEGYLKQNESEVNFIHDKIREAAYSLVSEEIRSLHHYNIAKGYIRLLDRYKLDDHIFTIVNQLNQGISHIKTDEEIRRHIEFNILAGKKALASNAHDAAAGFFNMATRNILESSWESDYQQTLDLYGNLAKAEYLSKNYSAAEEIFNIILLKAKGASDKIVVYDLKSSLYVSQNRMDDALDIFKKAVKTLGIRLPSNPSELSPLPEIIKFKFKFGKRSIDSLYDAPLLKDTDANTILHLLNSAIPPAFITQPALFPVIILKMVNLSLRKGNSPFGAFAYVLFGVVQGSGLGDYSAGYEFARLGLRLLSKFQEEAKSVECKTRFIFATMVSHWKVHPREGESEYLKSIASGRESGDLQYTSYAINNMHFQKLLMRQNLIEVRDSFNKYDKLFQNLKQYNAYQLFQMNKQFIQNLSEDVEDRLALRGEYFREEEVLPEWIQANNANALFDYFLTKSRLEYFFGDKKKALEYSFKADPYEVAMMGMMFVPEHVFFNSLIIVSLYQDGTAKEKKLFKKRLQKNLKRLKVWSSQSEASYGAKYLLCDALIFLINGDGMFAISKLKKSVEIARKYEFVLEEAIANEWIARIWETRGEEAYARLHLTDAKYCYAKWGCKIKAEQLNVTFEKNKSRFLETDQSADKPDIKHTMLASQSSNTNQFDLVSVIKASQAISSEIQLSNLLGTMMKILFENAGAESGMFLLNRNEGWRIEAVGNFNRDEIVTLQGLPLIESQKFPINIINFVIRTKRLVLLDDAKNSGMFVSDPYVESNNSKSVLCYPIINHGNFIGIIYLENNLLKSAFTEERVEVLKVLSAQIGMSVENSLLFANLEENVKERTKNLNDALVAVSSLKEQQDMDYYLNTLLVEPLGLNNASSKHVEVEFFLKQKKTFQFRGNDYELGGDINISDNMKIAGRSYTVFLNGDAMGKSVQGAGGVLVIGTIFKSIIQRTNFSDYGLNIYPERWIKNAYLEMQNAFASFDGTMLMSAIFGLVDDEMGTLYFMNVSHPDLLLYRQGKGEYIRRSNELPKLGHEDPTVSISLNVIALFPGDRILLGSDGRDDLIIGTDPDGFDIFNDDENMFLRNVEASDSDLQKLYELTLNSGKIIDDLSFLKIIWKGPVISSYDFDHSKVFKQIESLKENSDFHGVLALAQEMIDKYPHESLYLFELSYALTKLGQWERAIDFGEKLRLRIPDHLSNILNLVHCYVEIGKNARANEILSFAIMTIQDDGRLQKARETLRLD